MARLSLETRGVLEPILLDVTETAIRQATIFAGFNIVRLWRLTGGYLKQVLELLACHPGSRHVLCYFQAQTFEGPELWQACGAEIHARHRLCKMSRHQKQGYVWFLPWWHVLIWPIKNFAFSFFYIKPATVSSRAFVLCRMAQNILGQKLKRFQLKSSNPFAYARPVPLRKYQHPVLPPGNGPMVREGLLCELTFKWYGTESDLCLAGFTPCGCEDLGCGLLLEWTATQIFPPNHSQWM